MKKRHKGLFVLLLLVSVAAISLGVVAISQHMEKTAQGTGTNASSDDHDHDSADSGSSEDTDHEDADHEDADHEDADHDHEDDDAHDHAGHDHEHSSEAMEAAAQYTNASLKEITPSDGKLDIVTSFYPIYIAALNLTQGVDDVTVTNLSEPQTGCLHDYQLTPADMKLLSTADVFIINGGGIESFLLDVAASYPNLTIINACDGMELSAENPHVWMSVNRYRKQIASEADALSIVNPANASKYAANAYSYDQKLAELETEEAEVKELSDGMEFISLHEAYDYVAEDYNMTIGYTLNLDEERQVSAGEVADVVSEVKEHKVKIILAEENYGAEMGKLVAGETDAQVYYLDTLNRGEYYPDAYIQAMKKNIATVKKAVQEAQ